MFFSGVLYVIVCELRSYGKRFNCLLLPQELQEGWLAAAAAASNRTFTALHAAASGHVLMGRCMCVYDMHQQAVQLLCAAGLAIPFPLLPATFTHAAAQLRFGAVRTARHALPALLVSVQGSCICIAAPALTHLHRCTCTSALAC
jgi:hypothetical protein